MVPKLIVWFLVHHWKKSMIGCPWFLKTSLFLWILQHLQLFLGVKHPKKHLLPVHRSTCSAASCKALRSKRPSEEKPCLERPNNGTVDRWDMGNASHLKSMETSKIWFLLCFKLHDIKLKCCQMLSGSISQILKSQRSLKKDLPWHYLEEQIS